MTDVTIQSLSEYVTTVSGLCSEWADTSGPCEPWFRGQEDASWRLVPKAHRFTQLDEGNLRNEFRRRGVPLMTAEERPTSDWEWYFLMQHYGAPTRLLDWSGGALIALYFAIRNNDGSRDAAVWALDPWRLNEVVVKKYEVMEATDVECEPYLPKVFIDVPLPALPLAIQPPHIVRRIAVQSSYFTIHGSDRDGMSALTWVGDKPYVKKLVVPKHCIRAIRAALTTCGIVETTVFPDLEALARELTSAYARGIVPPAVPSPPGLGPERGDR